MDGVTMRECNVLIVGSGLSGLSAAVWLTRSGVDGVIVAERMSGGHYERYHHICGEAVSHRMMGLSGISRQSVVRDVDTIRISCGDVTMRIPVKGSIIDRVALLDEMRQASHAEFVKDSILRVRKAPGGFVVTGSEEEYRCRYLIGADGAFSIVRKSIFGSKPKVRFAAVNNIVEGTGEDSLGFAVSTRYPGAYRWDFPSKDGFRSVGYVDGTDSVEVAEETGKRFIVAGVLDRVVDGDCCLVGDAACLANPLCYGGIGAALLSGRKAAECIAKGDLSPYQKWVGKDRMFDPHFLKALETYRTWDAEDYIDSVKPFKGGYSILRGFYAILRRPKWANVYMATWMAFRKGW